MVYSIPKQRANHPPGAQNLHITLLCTQGSNMWGPDQLVAQITMLTQQDENVEWEYRDQLRFHKTMYQKCALQRLKTLFLAQFCEALVSYRKYSHHKPAWRDTQPKDGNFTSMMSLSHIQLQILAYVTSGHNPRECILSLAVRRTLVIKSTESAPLENNTLHISNFPAVVNLSNHSMQGWQYSLQQFT